jgi:hypothetical protein
MERKSFFENLEPRSALVVGVVAGLLTLGTIGFVVMLGLLYHGTLRLSGAASVSEVARAAIGGTVEVDQDNTPPSAVAPKSDRPKVELFVMSYCPYGLQMEKGFLPAWQLFKNRADIDVKFVHYAMHGLKEVQENTRQHCIQAEQPNVYQAYLQCFTTTGNSDQCLATAKVNSAKVQSCFNDRDKKFGVMAEYNDQSKWLSGQFPIFPIDQDLSKKYGVQGSPTLVINGTVVESGRSPEDIKKAICAAFTNPPRECAQTLSTVAFVPGFGSGTASAGSAGAAAPGCGT